TSAPSPPGRRSLAVIVNPNAGGGRPARRLRDVRAALDRLGLRYDIHETRSLEHARELAVAAAAAGEVAVAFGGDGLIGAVAAALRDTEGVLGVLPGGRGNDFARALKLPLDPAAACEVLASGAVTRLDLGRVGERTFVGIASCGLDSIANRIANETTAIHGRLVYAYAALRAVASWRPATFTVTVDTGEPVIVSGYTVAVANTRCYGGGMVIAPAARPDDGELDVIVVLHTPKVRFLWLLPRVFRGAHVGLDIVRVMRGSSVEIAASRPLTLYADGDPIAELPATVTVLPAAVRAIVPRGWSSTPGAAGQ
ncbi:MAG: diacylglycerol/lipid kinase family protein, partial [Solirubrobacteraceae bacterium]